MSSFKRQSAVGASRQDVLTSLRATQIVSQKPVLPAELIATILDYLPVSDLLRFARTSRRMREMVYDDTRWILRLKSMGCWNDVEARQRFEEGMKRKLESQRAREAEHRKSTGAAVNGSVNGLAGGGGNATLFDAGQEEAKMRASQEMAIRPRAGTVNSGFSEVENATPNYRDPQFALTVLEHTRSIRGRARQEYGKVYGALSPYYYDLARSRSHMDPILFRVYRDPLLQAKMLAQLKTFAKSDFAQGCFGREEKLDTMMGIFENAALREFEQGYHSQDIEGRMKKYAHVLITLNGGGAALDTFIHNHSLMLDKEKLGDPLQCLDGGLSEKLTLKPAQEFFKRLAIGLNEVAVLIDTVFPPSINVMTPFLERIGEDVISEYINPLLDEVHERNIESYLKGVTGLFEQCLRFAASLKSPKANESTFKDDVHRTIVHCFEQHIDLYLQDELDYFKNTATAQVEAWERRLLDEEASAVSFFMSNVNRTAAKKDFMTSFKKVIMMPVSVIPFGAASKPTEKSSAAGDILGVDPPSRSSTPNPTERSNSPRPDAPTSELAAKAAIMNSRLEGIKSLFSIEVALNLVHIAKASIERAALLVRMGGHSGEEAKEQCEAIFVTLLEILGKRHIKVGFDKAIEHLSKYNPREIGEHQREGVQPLLTFLELVNVGDLIQQMVDVFYQQELIATKLADGDDFISPAVKEKKRFEQTLDERVAAGLNKGINALMDEVEYICGTTQQPTDFNPDGNAAGVPGAAGSRASQIADVGPTPTARQIIDMVSSHINMLVGSTDKNMLEVFNQEVGLRLFTALCKHIKRQRISTEGAMKLISDMNAYHNYILTLKNKSLAQYFTALRELSQIYLISADDAKEIAAVITDGDRYHGIFRTEEVYEFAERRADWFTVKRDVERAMYGIGCLVM
ncbi:secretion pathway protein Sls2/Rcy1 [Phyllosticta capitalensis]